ncbi:hypothetical protein C5B42_03730 [Candidatus Cerribacteria bacterium 'Amazon FNV 2010 28 9']|uniref:Aminoglycoside phosphotransferase domain-containing protein n=1 Tax=Candidatus Cerribacteria bacterium 'Amazon FNV 2010 28 9' TaxID=2081795 RepID=A0A317JPR5_9BACT|nr:MAG: hypothetical protein C5B42_03730 [Candidatus Cerribacteria bacterium 'Amazon FNV 2010 28 9']
MTDFEIAAKHALAKYSPIAEELTPLASQPDRQVFLAPQAKIILKAYTDGKILEKEHTITQKAERAGILVPHVMGIEVGNPTILVMEYINGKPLNVDYPKAAKEAGTCLQRFHALGATPPFSGGQYSWAEFISWWTQTEIENCKKIHAFDKHVYDALHHTFNTFASTIADRPIVLLHGDLQAAHILVDPHEDKFVGFLDFADAQPGDPLMDIAVLSLWDTRLANLVLAGYSGIDNSTETQDILSHYRLLRHVAEIPWLTARGLTQQVDKNKKAIFDFLEKK